MGGSEGFQAQESEGLVHSYSLGKPRPDGEQRLHIDVPWPEGGKGQDAS